MSDNAEILEQAADWYDRQDEMDVTEKQAFFKWMAEPTHQAAFKRIASAMGEPELADALIRANRLNVVPLPTVHRDEAEKAETQSTFSGHTRGLITFWHACAASIVAIGLFVAIAVNYDQWRGTSGAQLVANSDTGGASHRIIAKIGKRESHVLSDGSVVYLNSGSEVIVDLQSDSRRVALEKGQAYFAVQHQKTRPFVVASGDTTIEVIGTAFDVNQGEASTDIVVYEGVVKISADVTRTLTKGQGVTITNGLLTNIYSISQQLPSWRTGWLDVEQKTLAEVIAELQRYSEVPIHLASNTDEQVLVTGRFSLDTPTSSLELLALSVGLQLSVSDNELLLHP